MIRRDGKLRYFMLTTKIQASVLGAAGLCLFLLVGWGASYTLISKLQTLEIEDQHAAISEAKLAYQDLMQQIQQHRDRLNAQLAQELSAAAPSDIQSGDLQTMEALGQTLDAFVDRLSLDVGKDDALANQIIKTRNTLYNELGALNKKLISKQQARVQLSNALNALNQLTVAPLGSISYNDEDDNHLDIQVEDDQTSSGFLPAKANAHEVATAPNPIAQNPVAQAASVGQQVKQLAKLFQVQSVLGEQYNQYLDNDMLPSGQRPFHRHQSPNRMKLHQRHNSHRIRKTQTHRYFSQ